MSESERRPQPERFEPLPGFLGLAAFAWRRVPRAARVALTVAGLVGLVVAVASIPGIEAVKRGQAVRERREHAAQVARQRRRLIADQRPRRGSTAPGLPRARVVAALEAGIRADANARIGRGELPGPPVRVTRCAPNAQVPPGLTAAARAAGGGLLRCLAVTSLGGQGAAPVAIGYEFFAAVSWRGGAFTWCKTNPPPGEKFGGSTLVDVALARECSQVPTAPRRPPPPRSARAAGP